jgi:peptide/nickel transport system permease protein
MRWRFVVRRLVILLASLLVASFVIFAALYLAPGDPIAALSGGRSLPPASVHVLEQRYHLNQPFLAQYRYWLDNALHGNLGISIMLRENVSTLIASRIWTTAGLVLYASLIIVVVGVVLGIVSGLRRGGLDTSTLVVTAVSAAIPAFVAAIALILLFAVKLGWFPALGNGTSFLSNVRHFTLPAIALATASVAIVARVTRASVRAESDREHVQTFNSSPILTQNIAEAKKLVQRAGATGKTITIGTSSQLLSIAALTGAYQAAAQAIGLKVVLRSVSAQDFIDFFIDPKFRAGIDGLPGVDYGDYADPAALLNQVVLPGGLENLDNFSDPAITAALEQARSTANLDQRAALVAKAEELTAQQLPWIPSVEPDNVLVLGKGLTGAVSSTAYLFSPWADSLGRAG